jgi:hypothetical protein
LWKQTDAQKEAKKYWTFCTGGAILMPNQPGHFWRKFVIYNKNAGLFV